MNVSNKKQLLDPLGSMCHIVSLTFKPLNTKIGINNHAIKIQESNLFQWLDRYWNGDNRENISLLYNIIIRIIEWYIVPLSGKYETVIQNEFSDESERKKFWACLEKMCLFLCKAFEKLQYTYHTGPVPTNVVTTLQYFINLIKDSINGRHMQDRLPKCINESETVNFLDYDKIRSLWNAGKLEQICDLYGKCFEKMASCDKTKDEQIESYMHAIDKLIAIHDNQFRELILLSNEG